MVSSWIAFFGRNFLCKGMGSCYNRYNDDAFFGYNRYNRCFRYNHYNESEILFIEKLKNSLLKEKTGQREVPSLRVHCYIDYIYLGRSYPKVHKAMDRPVFVYGRGHRILYHDYFTATAIARREYPFDPDAEKAAVLHIEYDRICSADPVYRSYLEYMAKKAAKERRTIKRTIKQMKNKTKKPTKKRKTKKGQAERKRKKMISPAFWNYGRNCCVDLYKIGFICVKYEDVIWVS
jgi:hypothetical protein